MKTTEAYKTRIDRAIRSLERASVHLMTEGQKENIRLRVIKGLEDARQELMDVSNSLGKRVEEEHHHSRSGRER